jgi:hypothetical protein
MRGTPNRGLSRGGVPAFTNSPASNIPRPALEAHNSSAIASDAGGSTMSASRAKQSKRDEVARVPPLSIIAANYSRPFDGKWRPTLARRNTPPVDHDRRERPLLEQSLLSGRVKPSRSSQIQQWLRPHN